MGTETDPASAPNGNEPPAGTQANPDPAPPLAVSVEEFAKLQKDFKRVTGALSNVQKERDEALKKFEEREAALAREQLSEKERLEADLADARKAATEAQALAETRASEAHLARTTASLTTMDLVNTNPKVVEAFMADFDPTVHADLKTYVDEMKAKAEWAGLFRAPAGPPPEAPGTPSGHNRNPKGSPEVPEDDMKWLMSTGMSRDDALRYYGRDSA